MGQTTTYLTMCQSVRQACGVSGTGPTSVANQSGILKEIVDWVKDGWIEVQTSRHDWLFKWSSFPDTFRTSAGVREYLTEIGDLRTWGTADQDMAISAYLLSDGQESEYLLDQWDYQHLLRQNMGTSATTQGKPTGYAITPSNELALIPIPDDTYQLRGQYYKDIQVLTTDSDIIAIDDRYVDVIKWLCVTYFGTAYESMNKYQIANQNYRRLFNRLVNEQTPSISYGAPLA